ncbi:TBC domain containing protein [Histomonas meleagridis]|uniref:TBC domain containing protein n=1 Tax=Histomonas meleagridis TaxID=135588 RepID=UPI00355A6B67|nr:TBC domain containing protein [Histomonas meleagridis]KAH0796537.1 TBC domain containing protein [Histomonas meleagridis]
MFQAYILYNPNIGYTQGMGDYISTLMILYIKEFNGDMAVFYDGRTIPIEKAESFIFWNFVYLLRSNQLDIQFKNMQSSQRFNAGRSFEIAASIHPVMQHWISSRKLDGLFFIYKSILLTFKRDYPIEFVKRIWDSVFSCDKAVFPRFFTAAVLFEIFPSIAIVEFGDLGDVISSYENCLKNIDQNELIEIAMFLYEKGTNDVNNEKYWCMKLNTKHSVENFKPRYFELINVV